jgi:preprotein translocase subunit SecB
MSEQAANTQAQNQQPQGQFSLQRIYVKDLSFEAPNAPKTFLGEWKPDVNVELSTQASKLDDGKNFEVVLSVTVTVKNAEQVAFIAEVKQAGIFLVDGVPEGQVAQLLGAYCPNLLFPYARETISDVVTRGSFPQMLLAPVNFDAVFAESLRQRQTQQQQKAAETLQ